MRATSSRSSRWFRYVLTGRDLVRRSALGTQRLLLGAVLILPACSPLAQWQGSQEPAERPVNNSSDRGSWSEPERLDLLPEGVYLQSPQLATRGATIVIVGTVRRERARAQVGPEPVDTGFFLHHSRLGRIPPPQGNFDFVLPRIVLDPEGSIHLFWAQRDPSVARRTEGPDLALTSLWYSRYEPARGWSRTQEVHRPANPELYISWYVGTAEPITTGADRVHLTLTEEGVGRLIHLLIDRGGVRRSYAEAPVGVSYSALAARGEDTLYLGLVAMDTLSRRVPGYGNTVHFLRSLDGGSTWSTPQVIPSSIAGQATRVHVHAGPAEAVHLVWTHHDVGQFGSNMVRHVGAREGGRFWSSPSDLHSPDDIGWFQSEIDRCGSLHVLIERMGPTTDRPRLGYARYRNGWGVITSLLSKTDPLYPAVDIGADGTMRVLFSVPTGGETGSTGGLGIMQLGTGCHSHV